MFRKKCLSLTVVTTALALGLGCGPTMKDPPTNQGPTQHVYDGGTVPTGQDGGGKVVTNPDSGTTTQPDSGTTYPGPDSGTTTGPDSGSTTTSNNAPGSTCSCDGDCASVGGQAGVCVFGICMIQASAQCSTGGSQAECPAGSRCWGLSGYAGSICWPDCASYTCAGSCDSDGSCVMTSGMDCDYTCGSYCSCQPGDCPVGEQCVNGVCEPQVSTTGGPGPGPGPTCTNLPPLQCTGTATYCGELVPFNPVTGTGYDNYPINGETSSNQYRSYIRRDLMMLIKYATAKVACKTANWAGDNWPLGLGDMSESNGAIPGTSIGQPGHPSGTHTNGYDIDVAYYQTGETNNYLRSICPHTVNGAEAYHCTSAPTSLDEWRTALFLGALSEHPYLRVVGADGQAGALLDAAITQLCADGWMSGSACNVPLAYEVTDQGYGWFYFHHHHMHVSLDQPSYKMAVGAAMPCMVPNCAPVALPVPVKQRPQL